MECQIHLLFWTWGRFLLHSQKGVQSINNCAPASNWSNRQKCTSAACIKHICNIDSVSFHSKMLSDAVVLDLLNCIFIVIIALHTDKTTFRYVHAELMKLNLNVKSDCDWKSRADVIMQFVLWLWFDWWSISLSRNEIICDVRHILHIVTVNVQRQWISDQKYMGRE